MNMIKKSILALSFMVALFSCEKPKQEQAAKPLGWEVLDTPVKSSLRGLSPVTDEIVWASGSNGTWLRTLDAGKTWDYGVIAGLDTVDFRSIHAFNAESAVAVSAGQPAVIYKTTDGGNSWNLVHQEGEHAFLDGISFTSETVGYVIGDPENDKWTVLQTNNQGDSWYAMLNTPDAVVGEAAFAASATSLLAKDGSIYIGTGGAESNLHFSSDDGTTWEKFPSPLTQGESSQGIFSIASMTDGEIISVGGDYLDETNSSKNAAIFMADKKEWVTSESSPNGYRSGVIYFPKHQWVIAVGPTGSDYSEDGGLNWSTFSKEGFHAVKIGKVESCIWASGADGKIGKLKF